METSTFTPTTATKHPRKPRQHREHETVNLTVEIDGLSFSQLPGVGEHIDIELTGEVDVVVALNSDLSYNSVEGIGEVRVSNLISSLSGQRIPLVKKLAEKLVDDLRGPRLANDMRIRSAALEMVHEMYDPDAELCGIKDQW